MILMLFRRRASLTSPSGRTSASQSAPAGRPRTGRAAARAAPRMAPPDPRRSRAGNLAGSHRSPAEGVDGSRRQATADPTVALPLAASAAHRRVGRAGLRLEPLAPGAGPGRIALGQRAALDRGRAAGESAAGGDAAATVRRRVTLGRGPTCRRRQLNSGRHGPAPSASGIFRVAVTPASTRSPP